MKRHSLRFFVPKSGYLNKSAEICAVGGIILGSFMTNEVMYVIHYILLLMCQCIQVGKLIVKRKGRLRLSKEMMQYMSVILCVFTIGFIFFAEGIDQKSFVIRILSLIAVFGIIICGVEDLDFDIKFVVRTATRIYVIICLVLLVDAVMYMRTGNAMWKPIVYLGDRYAGPFGDPNFLALFSTIYLIILLFSKKNEIYRYNAVPVIIIGLTIILAMALSTFLFLLMAVFGNWIMRNRSLRMKMVVLCGLYLCFLFFYPKMENLIHKGITNELTSIYGSMESAEVKYKSLSDRLDAQEKALNGIKKKWWGQGPRQIVDQLGRDTHNSYLGIIFEQGIFGFVLIYVSLRKQRNSDIALSICGNYLFLSALLLNVHYVSIYCLFLILQYRKNDNRCVTLLKGKTDAVFNHSTGV